MQAIDTHLQTQRIFGQHTWYRLPIDQWHTLSLPGHLEDQVLRIQVCSGPVTAFIECQVAEQFPKDAFGHLAKSLTKLGFPKAILNVIHARTAQAHLVVWDQGPHQPFLHMDLDFANLSEFDTLVLEKLNHLNHANWRDFIQLLRGQSFSESFFKTLRHHLSKIPKTNDAGYFCLVDLILKLLFLIFVQRKGWLNFDPYYLETKMQACHHRGLSILQCFLRPLFARLEGADAREWIPLGSLPRLGGGLFYFQPEHLPSIENKWLLDLYQNLVSSYSFSLFETRTDRHVIGISPEVLGHVFENLLQSPERKSLGTFFTPMEVALHQVKLGFDSFLEAKRWNSEQPDYRQKLFELKVLDPSCGSGTYLVAAFQELLRRHLAVAPEKERYNGKLYALKRNIMTKNLYGIDIHPMAVRLTEVRLWLNMIQDLEISDPATAPPLPSLQHKLRAGDFLHQYRPQYFEKARQWPSYARLTKLRQKFPFVGAEKRSAYLRHMLRLEKELYRFLDHQAEDDYWQSVKVKVDQKNLPGLPNGEDRQRYKKPNQQKRVGQIHIMFCDTMLKGGFDLVLGNPPWLSATKMAKGQRANILEHLRIPKSLQLKGQIDLSLYFWVASYALLKPGGHLGFLMPGKLLHAQFAKGFRQFVIRNCQLNFLLDYGIDQRLLFKADTFPLAIGIGKNQADPNAKVRIEIQQKDQTRCFTTTQATLSNQQDVWILEPKKTKGFLVKKQYWNTLGSLPFAIHRGVVTGSKRDFVFSEVPEFIPSSNMKPLVCGRDIQVTGLAPQKWIYWPFQSGKPGLETISRKEVRWLKSVKKVRQNAGEFLLPYRPKPKYKWLLVWKYLAKSWQVALVQQNDWVFDQTTYFIGMNSFEEAYRFYIFANAQEVSDYLCQLAERGKDRFFFFYAHTLKKLPVPNSLNQLPVTIPKQKACFPPLEAQAFWQDSALKNQTAQWKALLGIHLRAQGVLDNALSLPGMEPLG